MSDTDLQLLACYSRHRAEDAFAELVRRHVDLVHSAALRQVRSPQLAEEVAQSVFLDLVRQANQLAPDTIVAAWLYEVTRRTAIDVVRRETRRQLREQIATEMNAMNATADDWSHIEPLLDEAMHALDATDRAAVLLRYFENKSLRDVGAALGTSDDTAQKRVSRAVERLREFFAKRGVTVGASGLSLILSANAVQAAPAGLALKVSMAFRTSESLDSTMANGWGQMISAKTVILVICVAASVAVPFLIQRLSDARSRRGVKTQNEQFSGQFVQADFTEVNTASDLKYGSPEYWKALHTMAAGKTKDAFILSSALTQYVSKQSGMFPTNFGSIASYLQKLPAMTGTNDFEIVYSGSIEGLKKRQPHSLMLVRDRHTWRGPTGKMARVYGMLGGIAEIAQSDDNFEAWEKRHRVQSSEVDE